MTWLEAIILAIIEGLTEFIPVSSTGHMILASSIMGIEKSEFVKFFTVCIQLGAIVSVIIMFWKRFFKTFDFYYKILLGFVPAVIAGVLAKDYIDVLLESPMTVAIALILGGMILVSIDRVFKNGTKSTDADITYKNSFSIGCFQILAMIPGVSRSAATIIGGMSQGLSRTLAAEFSFFLAIPTMAGATAKSLYDYLKMGHTFSQHDYQILILGNIIAFIVAIFAIKFMISILNKYGFKWFGYYRIIIGTVILILLLNGHSLHMVD